jgi:rRNA-processing protein FCF1
LKDLPPDPVVVATNDRALKDEARAHRATIASSGQLLALLH